MNLLDPLPDSRAVCAFIAVALIAVSIAMRYAHALMLRWKQFRLVFKKTPSSIPDASAADGARFHNVRVKTISATASGPENRSPSKKVSVLKDSVITDSEIGTVSAESESKRRE